MRSWCAQAFAADPDTRNLPPLILAAAASAFDAAVERVALRGLAVAVPAAFASTLLLLNPLLRQDADVVVFADAAGVCSFHWHFGELRRLLAHICLHLR